MGVNGGVSLEECRGAGVSGTVLADRARDLAFYDLLPPLVRQTIRDAVVEVHCENAAIALLAGASEAELIEAIIEATEKIKKLWKIEKRA